MPISKNKKVEILSKLNDAIAKAKSIVFVNFHGLNVADTTNMRSVLRENGVGYLVSKKTLTKRVLDDIKIEGERPELLGELGVAWSDDQIAPAREIYNFQKKFPESLSILGGVFEGKYMSKVEMLDIATIPTMPVLRGKFVNIINSPMQRFVIGLSEIAKSKTA